MAITGKTGADAIFVAIHKVVTVLAAYAPKFRAVVATMVTGGFVTSAEAAVITGFLDTLPALEAALKKVADYSGLN